MDKKLRVIRRLYAIDLIVQYSLDEYDDKIKSDTDFNLCYENKEYFYDVVSRWVIEHMYYNYFSDIDDTSEEWTEIYNIMEKYIDSLFGKKIKDFFTDRCG